MSTYPGIPNTLHEAISAILQEESTKQEKAKALRDLWPLGMTYAIIGKILGISGTQAHTYANHYFNP